MKLMLKKFGVIFAIGGVLLRAGPSYAGVGVEPTITEIIVPPGRPTTGVFTVVNSEKKPIQVKVELEDWLKKTMGRVTVPPKEWLKVEPMEFEIRPRGTKSVEYTISPPEGYEGELIAMVFFASAVKTKGALGVTSRFGVSIYAAVEGTIKLACNIDNIKVKKSVKGAIFMMDIENRGNVHLRPTGDIVITDEYGNEESVTIARGFPLHPGLKLNYAARWEKANLAPGKYDAVIAIDYGKIYNEEKVTEDKVSFEVGGGGEVLE